MGLPGGAVVKNPPANAGHARDVGLIPLAWEDSSGGGEWQSTPVFLSGKSPRQRGLAGHSPWGRKESDTTEHACRRGWEGFTSCSVSARSHSRRTFSKGAHSQLQSEWPCSRTLGTG